MDRDLNFGCEEARMHCPPKASAPSLVQVKEDDVGLSGLFSYFSWLPTSLQIRSEEVRTPSPNPVQQHQQPLTVAAVVRHNLQPTLQKTKSSDPAPLRRHELWAQRESLALVHREREGAWRGWCQRRSSAGSVIDESLGLKVGDQVRFGKGSWLGTVRRAFPELDEYAIEVDGELFCDKTGKVRYFKADDLRPSREDAFDHSVSLPRRNSDDF
jgi:hypothetical protein